MAAPTAASRIPALFMCHGGGPMPLLGKEDALVAEWQRIVETTYAPIRGNIRAILVVSAHYETSSVKVGGAATPAMLYDYGGFPPETYQYKYPAPGSPEVAARVSDLLKGAGIECGVEANRDYDHGVFVPLMKLFPEADIPVVPLSVLRSQDPAVHIAIGKALAPLRDEGVFILGSGASTHNFQYLGSRQKQVGQEFGAKLTSVLTDASVTAEEREKAACDFLNYPKAIEAQAAGATEHIMPLFTVMGAGGGAPALEVTDIEDGQSFGGSWNVRQYRYD